jgi:hypothetical protein
MWISKSNDGTTFSFCTHPQKKIEAYNPPLAIADYLFHKLRRKFLGKHKNKEAHIDYDE